MVKIDKRKSYICVVDVETAGGFDNPMVYDIGFAITDKKGTIYAERSFVIKEVFENKRLMNTAYYAIKVPRYIKDIANGTRTVVSFAHARNEMNTLMEEYGVTKICAYNLKFDANALNNTCNKLKVSNKFLTSRVEMLCIWSLACELLYTQPTYRKVAHANGWISPVGNMRTSAEMGHRYITGIHDFEEEHTGLEDVKIEIGIMVKCFQQHKKYISGMIGNCWRIPNQANA